MYIKQYQKSVKLYRINQYTVYEQFILKSLQNNYFKISNFGLNTYSVFKNVIKGWYIILWTLHIIFMGSAIVLIRSIWYDISWGENKNYKNLTFRFSWKIYWLIFFLKLRFLGKMSHDCHIRWYLMPVSIITSLLHMWKK